MPAPPQQFMKARDLPRHCGPLRVVRDLERQDVRRRTPARKAAHHPCADIAPRELVRVRLVPRLEPGDIGDLAFHQMVPQRALHVVPVFRVTVVGQRDGQGEEVHDRDVPQLINSFFLPRTSGTKPKRLPAERI